MAPPLTSASPSLRRLAMWLALANCVIALGIVAATWASIRSGWEADKDRARVATENLAASLAIEIGSELKQIDNALTTIALQARRASGDPAELRRQLERAVADQRTLLPQVDTMRVADVEGTVIVGLGSTQEPLFVGDRDYFQDALHGGGLVISEPLFGRGIRKWGVVVARRLEKEDGTALGVVFTNLSTDHFLESFKGLTIGAEGAISLRTPSLRLIARYSAAEPHSVRGVGEITVSEDLRRHMAVNPRQGWYLTPTKLDNIERITAYRQVRGYPLTIYTGSSTGDFLAEWRQGARLQSALAAAVIFIVMGCSALIYRQQRREALARAQAAQFAREQTLMLDNSMVGLMRVRDRTIVWKNRGLDAIFGYGPDELQGQPTRRLYWDERSHRDAGQRAREELDLTGRHRTRLRMRRKDGTPVWVDLSGARVAEGESLWMLIDITAIKDSQATAEHLAVHDGLTGLPNGIRFTERLAGALSLLDERRNVLAVCHINLDGFGPVNERHGHEAGDLVLRVTALRLQSSVRAHDLVARLHGDEFAVLLTSLHADQEAQPVLQRMLALLQQPIKLLDGAEVAIGASIGIAFAPQHGRQAETLMRLADGAMTQAKRAGKRRIVSAATSPSAEPMPSAAPTDRAAVPTANAGTADTAVNSGADAQPRPKDPGPPRVPDHSFDESVAGEEDPGATLDGEDASRVPPSRLPR